MMPISSVVAPGLLHALLLHVDVGRVAAPVQLGDARLLSGVVDDDPSPTLDVRSDGRLRRDADAVEDQLTGHGPGEVEALAHRPCGGEQLVGLRQVERSPHGSVY